MRTVGVIQCRFGSARLPGKALRALRGRPLLSHVIERVQATSGLDEVILATSESERDTAIVSVAATYGVRTWRGSEHDVLGRIRDAARWANADVVVRVTADCPLWAPDVGSRVIEAYHALCVAPSVTGQSVYVWNDTCRSGYPDGLDVEVFSMWLLDQAAASTYRSEDREHVTPGIRRLALNVGTVRAPFNLTRLKLSVDREIDLALVASVVRHITPGDFSWDETARALVLAGVIASEDVAEAAV